MSVVEKAAIRVVPPPRRRPCGFRRRRRLRVAILAAAAPSASSLPSRPDAPDVVGFANVCVDVRIPVPRLPLQLPGWRHSFMKSFKEHPPKNLIREPGGVANTLFVTSRLGLRSTAVGHVASDSHGQFCKDCLEHEDIGYIAAFSLDAEEQHLSRHHPFLETTALCLVIVDPGQRHLFCSQFEVIPGPVFHHPSVLTSGALDSVRRAKALWMNGFAFQECSEELLEFLFEEAIRCNTATFFDPGPYGVSVAKASESNKSSFLSILSRSNVILATEEEAIAISGKTDPEEAGRALLQLPGSVTKWVIIKRGARGSLFFQRDEHSVLVTPGFHVHVSDTVGCGDSFAAAVVYGYLHRCSEEPRGVMELANAIGAITATGCGAGRNVADLDRVRWLLEKHHKHRSCVNGQSGIDSALELLGSMARDSAQLQPSQELPTF